MLLFCSGMAVRQMGLFRRRTRSERPAPTFAEFFAGIGLVRLGLERCGWRVAFANDIDPLKREMYDGHFGDADEHFDTTDVHKLDPDAVPTVDLATASFPCTDLSLAGSRDGLAGKQSSAFWGFIRVLEGMEDRRPPIVLLENVVGFLTSHGGQDFRKAMLALNRLGYGVDPFILDAKWFVPQSRPRLFVVGVATDRYERVGLIPNPRIRPESLRSFICANPSIRWRIHNLPDPPERAPMGFVGILDSLPDHAPEWWSQARAEYLYNQFSDRHRIIADELIAKRKWSYATVFRRVRPQSNGQKRSMGELRADGIAGCLRTPKGGSGRQILFKAGYGRYMARLLTPRECARLMGADGFRIAVPDNQAYFGFGDAVCVSVIDWIGRNYLNPAFHSMRSKSGISAYGGEP